MQILCKKVLKQPGHYTGSVSVGARPEEQKYTKLKVCEKKLSTFKPQVLCFKTTFLGYLALRLSLQSLSQVSKVSQCANTPKYGFISDLWPLDVEWKKTCPPMLSATCL